MNKTSEKLEPGPPTAQFITNYFHVPCFDDIVKSPAVIPVCVRRTGRPDLIRDRGDKNG